MKTDVEIKDAGTYRLSQSLSKDVVVDKDTQTMVGDIIAALKALSVNGKKDKESLKLAILQMQDVQRRGIAREKNIDENIDDILQAIDSLLSITSNDAGEIRLMMDRLLKMWEGKWYFNRSVNLEIVMNQPKRCKKSINSITPTLPCPLRGGGLGWRGKGHRR